MIDNFDESGGGAVILWNITNIYIQDNVSFTNNNAKNGGALHFS